MVFWSKKVEPPQENKEPSMEEGSSNLADIKFHDNEPSFVTRHNPPITAYSQGNSQPEQSSIIPQNSMNSTQAPSPIIPPPTPPQREVFLRQPGTDGIMAGPANPPKTEERTAPNTGNLAGGVVPPPLRPADLRSTPSGSPVQLNTGAQRINPEPRMPPPVQNNVSAGGPNIPPPPLRKQPEPAEEPVKTAVVPEPQPEEAPKPKLKTFSFGGGAQASKKNSGTTRLHWKYRFIGAAMVLVAVAVAVPFIFDSEPPAPSITIPLTIPSENGADTAPIRIPGALVQKVEEQHKADQEKAKKQEEKADVPLAEQPKSPELDEKDAEPSKVKEKPADTKKAEEARKAEEAKKVEEARKAEEAKIAAAKKAEAEKKKAEEAKKAADAKQKEQNQSKAAKGTYYIQLIATSDAKKVNSLVSMAKSNNVPYYIEQVTVKTGKVTRFRLGPFKTLKEAESARAKLGLAGIKTPNPSQVK